MCHCKPHVKRFIPVVACVSLMLWGILTQQITVHEQRIFVRIIVICFGALAIWSYLSASLTKSFVTITPWTPPGVGQRSALVWRENGWERQPLNGIHNDNHTGGGVGAATGGGDGGVGVSGIVVSGLNGVVEGPPNYMLDDRPDEERRTDYCHKCKSWRPARAHHCSTCGRCVLRMDHHCVWINNCVGHVNLKHFLLMLFYIGALCLSIFCSGLEHLIRVGMKGDLFNEWIAANLNLACVLMMAAYLGTTVTLFFIFQIWKVIRWDRTFIESLQDRQQKRRSQQQMWAQASAPHANANTLSVALTSEDSDVTATGEDHPITHRTMSPGPESQALSSGVDVISQSALAAVPRGVYENCQDTFDKYPCTWWLPLHCCFHPTIERGPPLEGAESGRSSHVV